MLASAGLANNGGPTQTIALQASSPAIGAGSNPEGFLADQRGDGPRTGPGGTDIGAVQHDAAASAPSAVLGAADVTPASAPVPYQFTVTYESGLGIAAGALSGLQIEVALPGPSPLILPTVVSTVAIGATGPGGIASGYVVTYQFTPIDGSWTPDEDGTYTVELSGSPVTDLGGNTIATGSLGSFTVNIPAADHVVIQQSPSSTSPVAAGSDFTVSIAIEDQNNTVQTGYNGTVTVALASGPSGATLGGTKTLNVVNGVASFTDLTLDQAATGDSLQTTASNIPPVTTGDFAVVPGVPTQVVVTSQPTSPVTVGQQFGFTATVEDAYGNAETGYSGNVSVAIGTNPGGSTLGGTTTLAASQGVATFTDLTLGQPGNGYTLVASRDSMSVRHDAAVRRELRLGRPVEPERPQPDRHHDGAVRHDAALGRIGTFSSSSRWRIVRGSCRPDTAGR